MSDQLKMAFYLGVKPSTVVTSVSVNIRYENCDSVPTHPVICSDYDFRSLLFTSCSLLIGCL